MLWAPQLSPWSHWELADLCLPSSSPWSPSGGVSGGWHHGLSGLLSRRLEGEASTGLLWENLTGLLMLGLRECGCGVGSVRGRTIAVWCPRAGNLETLGTWSVERPLMREKIRVLRSGLDASDGERHRLLAMVSGAL